MKLKSKLIATIVSICAAIAVMGVGVWAASTSFTVSVSNSVNLSFLQLDGTVHVSAVTGAEVLASGKSVAPSLSSTKIYDSALASTDNLGNGAGSIVGTAAGTEGADEVVTDVTKFLTNEYVDASKSKYAYVEYTFEYANTKAAGIGYVSIELNETSAPATIGENNHFSVYYLISTDGTNWFDLGSRNEDGEWEAKEVVIDASQEVTIKAICAYKNEGLVSVATNAAAKTWVFSLAFDTTDASTASKTAITGGRTLNSDRTTTYNVTVSEPASGTSDAKLFA